MQGVHHIKLQVHIIFEQIVIGQLNTVQGTYLRVRSAGTIRAITSLPWMLQCQRSVIIKVLDPPISNENRAHWGMNPSKWSINYETFPSHKGRKLLASLVPGSTKKCHVSQDFLTVT